MPTTPSIVRFETAADMLEQLGGIDPRRVRMEPLPGKATEQDLLRLNDTSDKLFELVDGTLVEKVMGLPESALAMRIGRFLANFAEEKDLGEVTGPDGTLQLEPGLVRLPDVAFISSHRLPGGRLPDEPVPALVPDLAVEVLSENNTPEEMKRKVREYCFAGSALVWLVDPRKRTIDVYTAPDERTTLTEGDTLDGGAVLPGLALPVADVFARVPRPAKKPPRRKKKS
jgi:Uma2 family endonuclease